MKLPSPELRWIHWMIDVIESGRLELLSRYSVSGEDLKLLFEYKKFSKMMEVKRIKLLRFISNQDALKMLFYFQKFGVDSGIDGHRIWVVNEYEEGYEARNDVRDWYIIETYKCKTCSEQIEPFTSFCAGCREEMKWKDLDFLIYKSPTFIV